MLFSRFLKVLLKFRVDFNWTVSAGMWFCLCLYGVCGLWLIRSSRGIDNNKYGFWFFWKLVARYQDDTCEITCRSDHPFKSYDQKSKCSIYVYHWMIHIRCRVKILAAPDTESNCAIRWTWVLSLHLSSWEQCMYNRFPVRDGHVGNFRIPLSLRQYKLRIVWVIYTTQSRLTETESFLKNPAYQLSWTSDPQRQRRAFNHSATAPPSPYLVFLLSLMTNLTTACRSRFSLHYSWLFIAITEKILIICWLLCFINENKDNRRIRVIVFLCD